MTISTKDSYIYKATESFCQKGVIDILPQVYEGVSGVDKGLSIQIIEDPDIPDSFLSAMEDVEKGRIVDLDQALNDPPPEE